MSGIFAKLPDIRPPRRSAPKDEGKGAPGRAVLTRLADVEPEAVEWLWPGRVPLGKITVLEGDPGLGKSTVALALAAGVSRGLPLPGGGLFGPAPVLLLSAEDGLADTVRPRLDAAGADVRRVFSLALVIDDAEMLPTLDGDLPRIDAAIVESGAQFLVVDPLVAFLGGEVNSYRDQDVRRALAPLAKMAERHRVAVLVVRHLTKGGGAASIYRGGGSIGIVGAARSALLVAKDPDDEARRIVAPVKSNLSKPPASLAYRIEEAPNGSSRIVWEEGEVGISADQLLAAQVSVTPGEVSDRSDRDDASDFLREFLSDGPKPATEGIGEGRRHGFTPKQLRRARTTLGVRPRKDGMNGPWLWTLPTGKPAPEDALWVSEDAQGAHVKGTGILGAFEGPKGTFGGDEPDDEVTL